MLSKSPLVPITRRVLPALLLGVMLATGVAKSVTSIFLRRFSGSWALLTSM